MNHIINEWPLAALLSLSPLSQLGGCSRHFRRTLIMSSHTGPPAANQLAGAPAKCGPRVFGSNRSLSHGSHEKELRHLAPLWDGLCLWAPSESELIWRRAGGEQVAQPGH